MKLCKPSTQPICIKDGRKISKEKRRYFRPATAAKVRTVFLCATRKNLMYVITY